MKLYNVIFPSSDLLVHSGNVSYSSYLQIHSDCSSAFNVLQALAP